MYLKRPITDKNVSDAISEYVKNSSNIVCDIEAYDRSTEDKKWFWVNPLCDITDILIRETGIHCKKHNSDVLITHNTMMKELKKTEISQNVFLFGIRDNGVDHLSYIADRIAHDPEILSKDYYHKIYAVYIKIGTDDILNCKNIHVQLKDISDMDIAYIEQEE